MDAEMEVNGPFVNILMPGDPKLLKTWLEIPTHQAQINTHIVDGKTALATAVMFVIHSSHYRERNLRIQCVRVLLQEGACVDVKNQDGSSCFDQISEALNDFEGKYLLDKNARNQIIHLLDCLKISKRKKTTAFRSIN